VTTFNSTTDQVVALKTGKVDTALFDAISARAIIRTHPDLGILDEGFFSYPLGMGFRRDRSELRARFDRYPGEARRQMAAWKRCITAG
jgi:polar amino acid transport system substrate-binding protein